MRILLQDLRYAIRLLLKSPGFAIVAVLTLALGIGANTAIFSVLDSVLLRTLPVSHPEELAVVTDPDSHGSAFGGEGGERSLLAYSEYQYLRDHNEVFSHIFAADSQLPEVELTIGNASAYSQVHAERARVQLVSGEYFQTLGVEPAAGQVFTPEVDRARGGAPIAVISYAFWKQRFGLDPSALGRTIRIHNSSFEIAGVSPPGFFGETVGQAPDVWVPITMQDAIYPGRDLLTASPQGLLNQHIWLQVMGRLKPGITTAQANASLNVAFKHLIESLFGPGLTEAQRREFLDQRLKVQSAARGASTLHHEFGEPLKFLMALVGRMALGAEPGNVRWQVLRETLVLVLIGISIGVPTALAGTRLVRSMLFGLGFADPIVIVSAALLLALVAALAGFLPARRASRVDPIVALRHE